MYEPGQSSVAFDPSQAGLALSYHDSDAVADAELCLIRYPPKRCCCRIGQEGI